MTTRSPFRPRLRSALFAALLGAALPAAALDTRLPDLGNSASALMTPRAERELGRAFMRDVRRREAVIDDPLIEDYIRELGRRLVEHSDAAGSPFHFFVIDNPEINAFAGPGGYIGVYTGLITTTETESELAAVLAHEIAHVTQQHLLQAWETASNMALPSAALLLASIAIGVAAGGDAGLATASFGQAAMLQEQINFTRDNEQEADRVGIDLLAEAGFDPNAMPAFFSRMGKATRVYASELPEFLLTHPVSTSRTADALGRAERYPPRQTEENLRYLLVRERIAMRHEAHPLRLAARLETQLRDGRYRNREATRYALALALLRGGRAQAAREHFAALSRRHPDLPEFLLGLARAEQALGRREAALGQLRAALERLPGSLPLALAYAELAIGTGRPGEAREPLRGLLAQYPEEPRLHALLARAEGEGGDPVSAHIHQAEYHYLQGDLKAAVLQLELALKLPGLRFYDASRIDSRLRELREELRERKKRE